MRPDNQCSITQSPAPPIRSLLLQPRSFVQAQSAVVWRNDAVREHVEFELLQTPQCELQQQAILKNTPAECDIIDSQFLALRRTNRQ